MRYKCWYFEWKRNNSFVSVKRILCFQLYRFVSNSDAANFILQNNHCDVINKLLWLFVISNLHLAGSSACWLHENFNDILLPHNEEERYYKQDDLTKQKLWQLIEGAKQNVTKRKTNKNLLHHRISWNKQASKRMKERKKPVLQQHTYIFLSQHMPIFTPTN